MTAIAISADGSRVYVAKRNRLEEWNARSGTLTQTLLQGKAGVLVSASESNLFDAPPHP
ncbi:MAG: hypothetical protein HC895_26790 [Leptolyngbyaceae cyanobacterium SM1_3_5]|nr:hypothetical protein [Leptolyngbyaceae cyanobacterium SM1_3_5]